MNTSVLVFRDINRNGIYDMGDQPMPNVLLYTNYLFHLNNLKILQQSLL